MEMSDQLQAQAALPQRKSPPVSIGKEAGWAPETHWTLRESNPGRPARSPSLCQRSYPNSYIGYILSKTSCLYSMAEEISFMKFPAWLLACGDDSVSVRFKGGGSGHNEFYCGSMNTCLEYSWHYLYSVFQNTLTIGPAIVPGLEFFWMEITNICIS
jgi:hypothetical protein